MIRFLRSTQNCIRFSFGSHSPLVSGALYNHSVDLWSLGILLYCLAFAQYPFSRSKTHEEMAEILHTNQEVVENIEHENDDLTIILKNLLSFTPEERYLGPIDSLSLCCENYDKMTFYDTMLTKN